jgi:Tfp pilus assembly protein PilO
MGYGGTILLVVILVIMVALLLLGIRGISWAQNAKKELEEEEEQRLVLKSIGDGQRSIAAALISIQSELADIRNRIAAIESISKDSK